MARLAFESGTTAIEDLPQAYKDAFDITVFLEDQSRKGVLNKDTGGWTKFGVSASLLDLMIKRDAPDHEMAGKDLNGDEWKAWIDENISLDQSREIGYREFWQPSKLDRVAKKHPKIAAAAFDGIFQRGQPKGTVALQEWAGATAKGGIGPETLGAIDKKVAELGGEDAALADFGEVRGRFTDHPGVRNRIAQNTTMAQTIGGTPDTRGAPMRMAGGADPEPGASPMGAMSMGGGGLQEVTGSGDQYFDEALRTGRAPVTAPPSPSAMDRLVEQELNLLGQYRGPSTEQVQTLANPRMQALLEQELATVIPPTPEEETLFGLGPTGLRVGAGIAGLASLAIPGVNGPMALMALAGSGFVGDRLAQKVEIGRGQRSDYNLGRSLVEGTINSIPLVGRISLPALQRVANVGYRGFTGRQATNAYIADSYRAVALSSGAAGAGSMGMIRLSEGEDLFSDEALKEYAAGGIIGGGLGMLVNKIYTQGMLKNVRFDDMDDAASKQVAAAGQPGRARFWPNEPPHGEAVYSDVIFDPPTQLPGPTTKQKTFPVGPNQVDAGPIPMGGPRPKPKTRGEDVVLQQDPDTGIWHWGQPVTTATGETISLHQAATRALGNKRALHTVYGELDQITHGRQTKNAQYMTPESLIREQDIIRQIIDMEEQTGRNFVIPTLGDTVEQANVDPTGADKAGVVRKESEIRVNRNKNVSIEDLNNVAKEADDSIDEDTLLEEVHRWIDSGAGPEYLTNDQQDFLIHHMTKANNIDVPEAQRELIDYLEAMGDARWESYAVAVDNLYHPIVNDAAAIPVELNRRVSPGFDITLPKEGTALPAGVRSFPATRDVVKKETFTDEQLEDIEKPVIDSMTDQVRSDEGPFRLPDIRRPAIEGSGITPFPNMSHEQRASLLTGFPTNGPGTHVSRNLHNSPTDQPFTSGFHTNLEHSPLMDLLPRGEAQAILGRAQDRSSFFNIAKKSGGRLSSKARPKILNKTIENINDNKAVNFNDLIADDVIEVFKNLDTQGLMHVVNMINRQGGQQLKINPLHRDAWRQVYTALMSRMGHKIDEHKWTPAKDYGFIYEATNKMAKEQNSQVPLNNNPQEWQAMKEIAREFIAKYHRGKNITLAQFMREERPNRKWGAGEEAPVSMAEYKSEVVYWQNAIERYAAGLEASDTLADPRIRKKWDSLMRDVGPVHTMADAVKIVDELADWLERVEQATSKSMKPIGLAAMEAKAIKNMGARIVAMIENRAKELGRNPLAGSRTIEGAPPRPKQPKTRTWGDDYDDYEDVFGMDDAEFQWNMGGRQGPRPDNAEARDFYTGSGTGKTRDGNEQASTEGSYQTESENIVRGVQSTWQRVKAAGPDVAAWFRKMGGLSYALEIPDIAQPEKFMNADFTGLGVARSALIDIENHRRGASHAARKWFDTDLAETLRGNKLAPGPEEQMLADAVEKNFRIMRKLAGTYGIASGSLEKYWPQMFNRATKRQLMDRRGPVYEALKKQFDTEDWAMRFEGEGLNNRMNFDEVVDNWLTQDISAGLFGHLEMHRKYTLPSRIRGTDGKMYQILEDSPQKVLPHYFNGAGRRIGVVDVFGQFTVKDGRQAFVPGSETDTFNALIAQMRTYHPGVKGDRIEEAMKGVWMNLNGRPYDPLCDVNRSAQWVDRLRGPLALARGAALSTMAIPNIIMGTIPALSRVGLRRGLLAAGDLFDNAMRQRMGQPAARPFNNLGLDMSQALSIAQKFGGWTRKGSLMDTLSTSEYAMGISGQHTGRGVAEAANDMMEAVGRAIPRITGGEFVNRELNRFASVAALRTLDEALSAAKLGNMDALNDMRKFFAFTEADLTRMVNGGVRELDVGKVAGIMAARTNLSVPTAMDTRVMFKSPMMRELFAFSAIQRAIGSMGGWAIESARGGNYMPLMYLAGLPFAAAANNNVRNWLKGRDDGRKENYMHVAEALTDSGLGGMWSYLGGGGLHGQATGAGFVRGAMPQENLVHAQKLQTFFSLVTSAAQGDVNSMEKSMRRFAPVLDMMAVGAGAKSLDDR